MVATNQRGTMRMVYTRSGITPMTYYNYKFTCKCGATWTRELEGKMEESDSQTCNCGEKVIGKIL